MPSPERIRTGVGRFELLLICVSALGAIGFWATLKSRLPSDADYRNAAVFLEREARPGDALVLVPWWTDRARLFLPKHLPIEGYLHQETNDFVTHPRLWVLVQPRLPHDGIAQFERAFLPDRILEAPAVRFGTLELRRYRNGRARSVRFSAVDAIAQAHVYLERPQGARLECPFDGVSHRCPGGGDLHVAAEWHELFYAPRRCLWMKPPGGDARLVVEFANVPAGVQMTLEGGIVWEHAPRKAGLTPLHVGVDEGAAQAPLASLRIEPGDEGMREATWTPASNLPRTLRLWTQSDKANDRESCVELRALGDVGSGS